MTEDTRDNASPVIGISDDRLKHMLGVGRRMVELAKSLGYSEDKQHEMMILGFLHDIGYEFVSEQLKHADAGGEILKRMGFKYWPEVHDHGKPEVELDDMSTELFMLNTADMQVNNKGDRVTVDDRLADIATRYGRESPQYIDAAALATKLAAYSATKLQKD